MICPAFKMQNIFQAQLTRNVISIFLKWNINKMAVRFLLDRKIDFLFFCDDLLELSHCVV